TPTLYAHEHGIPTTVNAQPIPPEQEWQTLLTGTTTYTHTDKGHELVTRTPHIITTGQPTGTIHAQHKCPTDRNRQQFREARQQWKQARHHARLRTHQTGETQ
ncbi:MAG TPA: hypothetical protein VKZ67_00955, partial [Natronosporangium sp.]|nr:hypothetical protein [Natronosporangium sp.]